MWYLIDHSGLECSCLFHVVHSFGVVSCIGVGYIGCDDFIGLFHGGCSFQVGFVFLCLYYIRVIFASSLQIFKLLKNFLNFFQEVLRFPVQPRFFSLTVIRV